MANTFTPMNEKSETSKKYDDPTGGEVEDWSVDRRKVRGRPYPISLTSIGIKTPQSY